MKKILQATVIIIILALNMCYVYAEKPQINDGAYILIDAKSGEVLLEKNSDMKGIYPASTTKIMTALLAIENGKMDQLMTASQAAVNDIGKDGSNIGIMPGEQLKTEDLLKALLICSANETANIIAENICPTRQDFVDMMNKKAQELGALNTHFVNPCGSHNPDHYTTPADLAKIARYAMTFPKFREIVSMKSLPLPATNKHDSWPLLSTTNKLMQTSKNEFYTIDGIKTGYTVPAGYNLVASAFDSNGMELISVIMDVKNGGAQAQNNVKKYTKALLDYGFQNFEQVTLQSNDIVYRSVTVEDAVDDTPLDLITKGEVKYVLPKGYAAGQDIKEVLHFKDSIIAPVNKDDIMGYIDYQKNGESIGKVDLVASKSVKQKPQAVLISKVEKLSNNTFIRVAVVAVAAILVFLLLRLILKRASRRKRQYRNSRIR